MAKVILNPWFVQFQGHIGELVFKRYGERMVLASKPDMSGVQWSEAQQAGRERFRRAAKAAKRVLADPVKRAEYAIQAREQGTTMFGLALRDCYWEVGEEMSP